MKAALPAGTSTASRWRARWKEALDLWGSFIRLPEPIFCADEKEALREGLTGSFAMIRLTDHRIVLSLPMISDSGLEDHPLEIMGHEIGHHVYCPADLTDTGRMIARIRRALPGVESYAPMIGNLYTDLLINDRLFRYHKLPMDIIYRKLKEGDESPLWTLYMRTYEILWGLDRGSLTVHRTNTEMEGNAILANRVIRSYASDWVRGAGRFAALCYPYLTTEKGDAVKVFSRIRDTGWDDVGDMVPAGLTAMDDDELEDSLHPALDGSGPAEPAPGTQQGSPGNYREPFEYGQILKALGSTLSKEDITARYYRERALPHLVPFPVKKSPRSTDPFPEGLDQWEPGSPLDRINWIETLVRGGAAIPGVTTVETHYGSDPGFEKEEEPVDLDLYVDSSGSMPDPSVSISYLSLAGAIIALSALRAGSRVQATLWSGTREFITTGGFIRDEEKIFRIITGHFGGATAFPIHILRDTYLEREKSDRKVHILHISDEGITTMYDKDEKGNPGKDIAARALERAGGGGTMALNLWGDWKNDPGLIFAHDQGWDIYPIREWDELLAFSREFARRHYGKKK